MPENASALTTSRIITFQTEVVFGSGFFRKNAKEYRNMNLQSISLLKFCMCSRLSKEHLKIFSCLFRSHYQNIISLYLFDHSFRAAEVIYWGENFPLFYFDITHVWGL